MGHTADDAAERVWLRHEGELAIAVVLAGEADVAIDDGGSERVERLGPRDSLAIPAGVRWAWSGWGSGIPPATIKASPRVLIFSSPCMAASKSNSEKMRLR